MPGLFASVVRRFGPVVTIIGSLMAISCPAAAQDNVSPAAVGAPAPDAVVPAPDAVVPAPDAVVPAADVVPPAPATPALTASSASPPPTTDTLYVLQNDEAKLLISPLGASIAFAELKAFDRSIRDDVRDNYRILTPVGDHANRLGVASMAPYDVFLPRQGPTGLRASLLFHLFDPPTVTTEPDGSQRLTFRWPITAPRADGGQQLLELQRSYTLASHARLGLTDEQAAGLRSAVVLVEQRIRNVTAAPIDVEFSFLGPLGMRSEELRGEVSYICSGFRRDGRFGRNWHIRYEANELPIDFVRRATLRPTWPAEHSIGGNIAEDNSLLFTAKTNRFFISALRPLARRTVARVDTVKVFVDRHDATPDGNPDFGTLWRTPLFTIPAGGEQEIPFELYLSPQAERELTAIAAHEEFDYAALNDANLPPCTFTPLAWAMKTLLWIGYSLTFDYGFAIILLVAVVRILLHPLTRYGQIQLLKFGEQMKRLQPKVQALKEKHGDDRAALNTAMQRLMIDEGINPTAPALGCIPLFIQTPIWAALYYVVSYSVELRHQPVQLLSFWILDLSAPDSAIWWPPEQGFTIPIIGWLLPMIGLIHSVNLLPFVLGGVMYVNQKLMPQPSNPSADPQQEAMQKAMYKIMPWMFALFMYNMPAGLNLYIATSMLVGIFETKAIRKNFYARHPEYTPPGGTPATPAAQPVTGTLFDTRKSWRARQGKKRR